MCVCLCSFLPVNLVLEKKIKIWVFQHPYEVWNELLNKQTHFHIYTQKPHKGKAMSKNDENFRKMFGREKFSNSQGQKVHHRKVLNE